MKRMRKRRRHLLKTRDHIPRAFSRQPVSQITTILLRAPAEEDRVERGCKVVELRLEEKYLSTPLWPQVSTPPDRNTPTKSYPFSLYTNSSFTSPVVKFSNVESCRPRIVDCIWHSTISNHSWLCFDLICAACSPIATTPRHHS
jgi:hypothetical protein